MELKRERRSVDGMNPTDVAFSNLATTDLRPCEIYVDEEGDWFHKGSRIIREDIIELFVQNLSLSVEGAYLIEIGQNRCILDVADTPFVVSRVDFRPGERAGEDEIVLRFRHIQAVEPLEPDTLRVGKENVLYCRIQGGKFCARFSRPAYYQLAEWIGEDPDSGSFYLDLNGRHHPIPTPSLD
jgi:uncharacterized protein